MRPKNWPEQLYAFLEVELPFAWGTRDCCIWACDWVKQITEKDPAADLRGTYDTGIGAMRALQRVADGTVYGMARQRAQEHEFSGVAVPQAQRGDVVFVPANDVIQLTGMDGCLGLCVGSTVAVLDDTGEPLLLPMNMAGWAWRIN